MGMKSRGVYETPGGTILLAARRGLESITLDRGEAHLKDELMPKSVSLSLFPHLCSLFLRLDAYGRKKASQPCYWLILSVLPRKVLQDALMKSPNDVYMLYAMSQPASFSICDHG